MDKLSYLALAYAAIWTGIFLYLVNIAKKLSFMQREVLLLKKQTDEK
jgi:CcmD family protein